MSQKETSRVLLLGASSWIGHYVLQYLRSYYPLSSLIATYRAKLPHISLGATFLSARDSISYADLIKKYRPHLLLNLNRGEDESDYQTHLTIIEEAQKTGCHYAFASSFNACDANLDQPHLENEIANAQSEYGKFKARCEHALFELSKSFTIFRFSATHGWAPNRIARTEDILKKLQCGEHIVAEHGVIQNRTAVCDLAGMMVEIMQKRGQGIYNLGTIDSSDEVDFLRKLARAFGYSNDRIAVGETNRINAEMIPSKLFDLCGSNWQRTETDTINFVSSQVELQQYRYGS